MTLEEAIADKDRPLSMTPQDWMRCAEAEEEEDKMLVDDEAKRIVSADTGVPAQEVEISSEEKLDIGIEQMVLGCKMAMRALQELSRADKEPWKRGVYDKMQDAIYNGVGPYLVDVLDARKGFRGG